MIREYSLTHCFLFWGILTHTVPSHSNLMFTHSHNVKYKKHIWLLVKPVQWKELHYMIFFYIYMRKERKKSLFFKMIFLEAANVDSFGCWWWRQWLSAVSELSKQNWWLVGQSEERAPASSLWLISCSPWKTSANSCELRPWVLRCKGSSVPSDTEQAPASTSNQLHLLLCHCPPSLRR